jgi:hypothetical protein
MEIMCLFWNLVECVSKLELREVPRERASPSRDKRGNHNSL